jgi:hypothetical protein
MCKQSGGSCFRRKAWLYTAENFGRFFLLYAGQERMSPHRLYTSTPIPHPSTGTRARIFKRVWGPGIDSKE